MWIIKKFSKKNKVTRGQPNYITTNKPAQIKDLQSPGGLQSDFGVNTPAENFSSVKKFALINSKLVKDDNDKKIYYRAKKSTIKTKINK